MPKEKIKDMQNALNKNLHVKRTNKKHVAGEKWDNTCPKKK